MKVYLNVPFSDIDYVKRKGARWDPERKKWYIENLEKVGAFLKYMDERYTRPHKPVAPSKKLPKWVRPKSSRR